MEKIEHLGNVELEDDVEIAACTIDRGSLENFNKKGETRNQVHIVHNCTIGKNTIIGAKMPRWCTLIGDDCLIGEVVE